MSALEIEVGKDGLEVEAKGSVILIVACIAFVSGFVIGGYLGFKVGSQFKKKDD